jgi:hypothetical protein
MLIICKTSQVHHRGARWRQQLPLGWEIRWQRMNAPIMAVPRPSNTRASLTW